MKNKSSDWVILEKEIGEGVTIGDLLTSLAPDYNNFRNSVFNPDTGEFSEEVMIMLNDNLMQYPGIKETKLNNGDTVMLALVFIGG